MTNQNDAVSLIPLPVTHYNGCGDGSEPLWTEEQMIDYANACVEASANVQAEEVPAHLVQGDAESMGKSFSKWFEDGGEDEKDRQFLWQIWRESWRTALQSPASDAQRDDPARIGPRELVDRRPTCEGCPSLQTKEWSRVEDEESDCGTSAHCMAAGNKGITAYWDKRYYPPTWCPAIAAQAALKESK